MASNSPSKRSFMLIFTFCLAVIAFFLQGIFSFSFSLFVFAPWVALVTLKTNKTTDLWKTLWLVSLAGSFNDLFSDHPMGLYPITYCLSSLFLFRFRNHFLYEKPFHLALFTAFISFFMTQLELFFLFLFDRRVPYTGKWAVGDWLGMPIADGLFACIWFAGPMFLLSKANRLWVLFWIKKNLSPTSH